MITIRPSDYYSLSYDAAAQNTVDELFGNNHKRVLAEQSITLAVTELKTVRMKAPFVPGTWQQSFLRSYYDYMLQDGSRNAYSDGTIDGYTTQYTVLADYEVIFNQLNLPEKAVLSAEIQPEITSKHTAYHKSVPNNSPTTSTDDAVMLGYLDSDGYDAESGFYNCESNDKFCLSSGTLWNAAYKNISYSISSDLNDAFKQKLPLVDMGIPYTVPTHPNLYHKYFGIEQDDMELVWTLKHASTGITAQFRRAIRNLYSHTIEKLDRDTVRVTGRMPVATMHESLSHTYSNNHYERQLYMGVLEKLNVKLSYQQMAWNNTSFDHLVEGSQKRYPYKFSNERLANIKDKVGDRLWSDYYPQLIFGKYSNGCYYVQLKVRAKFMLVNDLHIDSEVQIYDLEGKLISRNNQPCTFRIKRIIKTYDNSEFTYTINCLEE